MVDLAIIILNYNTKDLLRKTLRSIIFGKWKHSIKIWVVDNASRDGSAEMVKKEFPQAEFIQSDSNLGFAGGNNLALKKAQAHYYLLLNSDTEVTESSLDSILEAMKRNNFDIASCKLINPDGSLQPNAGDLPFGFSLYNWLFGLDDLPYLKEILPSFHRTSTAYYNKERKVGWISGTAFLISKGVLESVGLLDDNIFMYCEDVDYCIRAAKKGFTIGYSDKAIIKHIGGGSSSNPQFRQWLGEFKELIYLHKKYKGTVSTAGVKTLIYIAIIFRIIGFLILGKPNYSKTYLAILLKL